MTYPDKGKIFFKGDWIKKLERKCNLLSCVEWKSWLLQNETLHDIIVAPNIPEKIIEFLPLELHSFLSQVLNLGRIKSWGLNCAH